MATTGDSAERSVDTLRAYVNGVIGQPIDDAVLERALTHRSFAYENGGLPNNERLEFLGDAVLGLVITDTLYAAHPDLAEGQLAKLRASVVNMRALADVGRTIDLGDYVHLGRGEETTGGRDKASILADTMEALIGTIYLSGGLPAAARFVHHLFDPLLQASASMGAGLDWKTSLQELCSAFALGSPEYRLDESGPDHEKSFLATVTVAGDLLGTGQGRSKKEAEQRAAEQAWIAISERERKAGEPAEEDNASSAASVVSASSDAVGEYAPAEAEVSAGGA